MKWIVPASQLSNLGGAEMVFEASGYLQRTGLAA
jgi:hypothetical protein